VKTIKLYGEMGKKFGREFELDVATPAEAVRALCSQIKGFRAYLHEHAQDSFKVFVGGRNAYDELTFPCSDKEIIRIAPVVQGASAAARIVIGIVLIIVAWWNPGTWAFLGQQIAASSVMMMGASMVMGGVIQLLSQVDTNTNSGSGSESANNTPSYNFDGPVNTTAQGHPVPICYGRMIVGSAVISAGLTTV